MKQKTGRKLLGILLTLALVFGLMPGMGLTAYAAPTERLLTTITATGKEQASYSTANVATVSFSYTAGGSSGYTAIWGWWGYGWSATVNAAEGYNITKCIFYDDANRTATDSEAPFIVETTEEDKTPKVNGTPILAYTSKGIKKIEVYGYATPAHTHDFTNSASGATITATCSADGCDLDDGTEQHNHTATLTIAADEYSSKYYANGAAPMGIIETPTLIKNPDLLRQSWNEAFGGTRNAGKVAVLEQGTTFKPISLSPQDSQLLDTRKFSVEEICRIFRVPPHLVQDLGRATFTLNGRLICGKCGRTLKRYVKLDDALIDWRCRQRALVKKTDFHEDVSTRCDCRIVREVEAQRTVVMAFNTLPSRREELVVLRERLLTGEIGRIDALLKTLDGQQDRLEERLEVLASQVPEDEEPMNTTVVDEVGSTQVITSEMDEAAFLRSQIVEIRRRKDGFYAERAEHANTEVQIRLLLELVDEMVKNSLPEWMQTHASSDALKNDAVITGGSADGGGGAQEIETDGSCRDFDDFFNRTKYIVPEGVLDENGRMERFKNNLVIRYMDKMVVKDDGYEVAFKAGVRVEVKV